jgi:hypothetical protein
VPGSSSKDTWSTTVRSPYFLVSPLTVIMVVLLVRPGSPVLVRDNRPGTPVRVSRAATVPTAKVVGPSTES